MNNPAFNSLLRWGVENSDATRNGNTSTEPRTQFDPKAFEAFLSGGAVTSETTQMEKAMDIIENDSKPLEVKKEALLDLETLVGQIDNANYLESKGLWTRLISQLEKEEAILRANAAWCCSTAVANNPRGQERLLVIGAIPTLVRLATEDADPTVRRKSRLALSSAIRNYPPGLDAVLSHLPANYKPEGKIDVGDMGSVDSFIGSLAKT